MNTLQTSLFAITIGYCLLCAFSLRSVMPQLPLRFFSVYLLLEAVNFSFEWLVLHPDTGFKSLWLGGLMQLSLLIAPCLWLCTLEITRQQTPHPRLVPPLHKALILIASLCVVPLLLSAHGENQFPNADSPISPYQSLLIHGGMLVSIGIFTLQVPMFFLRIRLLLQDHERQLENQFSNIQEHSLHALNWLLWVLAIKWLMSILRTLHCMYIGPVGGMGINLFMTIEILFTLRALFALSRLKPSNVIELRGEDSDAFPANKDTPEKY
ncbi:MAG: hypothetical protein Q7T74_05245, partial [Candidatus Saccharibacteria bacterium]|nr:hypothetical protein [Candidatus Saccharibacteria bacterium]